MFPDHELLRQYTMQNDEAAFTELVRRHVDLVYSAALRQVGGDRHLAQDVTQNVFTALARQAHSLVEHTSLTGWLYTTTKFSAVKLVRNENRRAVREQEASIMENTDQTPEPNWDLLRPVLDEAVCELDATDRNAVLLRFFQNKSHREVGDLLGLNEDTARKRVERALEKLRAYFTQRGVTVSAALLATVISANSVQAAPVGLATTVAGVSLAGASGGMVAGPIAKIFLMTSKTKIAIAGAALILVTATVSTVYQQQQISHLKAEMAAAHKTNGLPSSTSPYAAATFAGRIAAITKLLHDQNSLSSLEVMRALVEIVDGVKSSEFGEFLAALEELPNQQGKKSIMALLIARWAESNPADALTWAKNQTNTADRNAYMQAVFTNWPSKDLLAALDAVKQVNEVYMRNNIEADLLARLSSSDPKQALDILRSLPVGQQKSQLYNKIFKSWGGQDPSAALAAVQLLPAGAVRLAALEGVYSGWAGLEATAALRSIQSLPASAERSRAQQSVLNELAKQDPATAVQFLATLPAGSNRNNLITSALKSWGETDAAAALAWLSTNAKGSLYGSSISGLLTNLSNTDPAAALMYVGTLPQNAQRENNYATVLGVYAQTDPADAMDWLNKNLTGHERDAALSGVVSQLAKTDPASAANYYSQMPPGGPRDSITVAIADSLATQDTPAALEWVQNLPTDTADTVRSQAMKAVITSWKNLDPVAAAHYMQNLADDPTMAGPAGGVAYAYAQNDGPGALAWAQSLPAGPTQDNAMRSSLTGLAQVDPATAWIKANDILQAQGTINKQTAINGPTLRQIITAWAETDPAAATLASMNITTDGTRINSITAAAASWAEQDPAGLFTWMQALPAGPERDAAVAQYVTSQAAQDPEAAYKLATSIGDDASRYNQILISIANWARKDPAAAAAALSSAPVTPAQQKAISNAIKKL
jgi:RNA polymerase sigma factor (sigma-70 family)